MSYKLTNFNLEGIKFEPLNEEQQKEWDKRIGSFLQDLEKGWPDYYEKMRKMKLRNYQLSLTRVIG